MKRTISLLAWLFIVGGVIFSVIVLVSISNDDKISLGFLDWEYAKKISDVFGILAFLFTGAGTFAIFLTLIKQQEQFDEAQKQILTQQFEVTFFNMLQQLFTIKDSIRGEVEGNKKVGQEYLNHILKELRRDYRSHLEKALDIKAVLDEISHCTIPVSSKLSMIKDDLNDIYLTTYNNYHSHLGHFFRYFYNLVKFITDNRENDKFKDAGKYIQLIQAQLSNDELGLIFCNSLSEKALNSSKENKVFCCLEAYSFLENIDAKSLLHRSLHVLYPKTHFKFVNNSEKKMRSEF
ncbi:putative phage abortive infection protein [Sphingobacterium paludis]|nr:putative phage abortive infection protein [Sphingobacterium paludis]